MQSKHSKESRILALRFISSNLVLLLLVLIWNEISIHKLDLLLTIIGSACVALLLIANSFIANALVTNESVCKTRKTFLILSGAGLKISLLAGLLRLAPLLNANQALSLCVGVSGVVFFGIVVVIFGMPAKSPTK